MKPNRGGPVPPTETGKFHSDPARCRTGIISVLDCLWMAPGDMDALLYFSNRETGYQNQLSIIPLTLLLGKGARCRTGSLNQGSCKWWKKDVETSVFKSALAFVVAAPGVVVQNATVTQTVTVSEMIRRCSCLLRFRQCCIPTSAAASYRVKVHFLDELVQRMHGIISLWTMSLIHSCLNVSIKVPVIYQSLT